MDVLTEEGLEHFASLVKDDIKTKADTNSPVLTGTPEAPTPGSNAASTQIATVGYVDKSVDGVSSAVESAQSTADSALTAAKNAQTAAENAQTSADNAQTSADKAQRDATDALDTINDTRAIAEDAATKANEAIGAIDSVSSAVEAATNVADEASKAVDEASALVDSVQETINSILSTVDESNTLVNQLDQEILNIKAYEPVGEVDLDTYYDTYAKIYITSGSSNIPPMAESYYVEINTTTDMSMVIQTAIGAATGNIYFRNGSLTDDGDLPLTATSGTLIVNGDVSANLSVNGNVQVSGTISGIVNASGSITCKESTGTTNQNTNISENDCDISVNEGTLTFNGDLVYDENDVLYTTGMLTNDSEDTIIYRSLTIETDSEYGLHNTGTISVKYGSVVTSTNTSTTGYGIYNERSFIVDGDVYGNGSTEELAVYGEFSGLGHVYANSNTYYDGSENGNAEPTTTYSVEWDEWILSGSASFLSLNGGTMNGNIEMGLGTEIIANGVTITSEGHIKLSSGVEFF